MRRTCRAKRSRAPKSSFPSRSRQLAEAVAAVGKPIVVVLKHGRALALEGAVAERAGDPRHLVPRHRDRQCHRRRAVRRLQPFRPASRELPARVGAGALLLRAQGDGPAQPAGRARSRTRRTSAASRTARSTRSATASPTGRSNIRRSGAKRADDADERRRSRCRRTVTNRGSRAAEEVVQLYIHDRAASVTRPVRELKAFRKIALAPGQSRDRPLHASRQRSRLLRPRGQAGDRAGHVRRVDRAVSRELTASTARFELAA